MGFSNKFVMVLLIKGVIQQERKDGTLEIPFGTDYSIRLRNKHNRRAVGEVFIDGESVGKWVVPANGHIDIHRHQHVDRSFRFVSLDSGEAHEHGKSGNNPDKIKGVVEARFHLEKETVYWNCSTPNPVQAVMPQYDRFNYRFGQHIEMAKAERAKSERAYRKLVLDDNILSQAKGVVSHGIEKARNAETVLASMPKDGCTVEGVTTGQRFGSTHFDYESSFTSIKIVLRGYASDQRCAEYITTPLQEPALPSYEEMPSVNKFCTGCGTPRRTTDMFCGQCGKRHD